MIGDTILKSLAVALGLITAAYASPATADPNQQWQEKHRDIAFLAGRWMDTTRGNEFTFEGNQLVLSKKRGNHYKDTPVGFAVVTNIRFSKVSRSNAYTVQYEFAATCNQYRANGNHFSYPANQFLVIVNSGPSGDMIEGFSRIGSQCVNAERPPVLMTIAAAANQPAVPVAGDNPAVDQQFLALIQGAWESRHQSSDDSVQIAGREVRLIRQKNMRSDLRNTPTAGTAVGIIDSIKPWGQFKSPISGAIEQNYLFTFRGMTHNGQSWLISDSPSTGRLRHYTHTQEARTGYRRVPVFDYLSLTGSNSFLSDVWRPDDKARIFGKAPLPAAAATPQRGSQTVRPVPARSPVANQPVQPESMPVTSAQELAEIATRERLNREQAAFAAKQVADNAAAKAAFDKATADHAAALAAREATIAAQRAEAERKEREYQAALAKWRADAEACKGGDLSRCQQ